MGDIGIYVDSDNNLIEDNTITDCEEAGIYLGGNGNTIRGNTIANSEYGILCEDYSYGNMIYHNNFMNNTEQASDLGSNTWVYMDKGNHWSDYNGTDANNDNTGDTPYTINIALGTCDFAPLIFPCGPLSGDLNYDGIVDVSDLGVAAISFGSHLKHPRWDPASDINDDGLVDMLDMVLIAMNFGKTG
jgi:parallel beta-helix repeat protein